MYAYFYRTLKKVNYWSCYILQIHSLRWNINLNNCTSISDHSSEEFDGCTPGRRGNTGQLLFFMHCQCNVQSPPEKDRISKIHSEMQKSNKHCESSSKLNQMGWAQMTGVPWTNFSGLDCISICYCSTFYKRMARISHVLSGASPH